MNKTYSKQTDVFQYVVTYITENYFEKRTRAVIIDFNFYNKNTDFFCSVELMIEINAGGGFNSKAKILPFRLYRNWTSRDKLLYYLLKLLKINTKEN